MKLTRIGPSLTSAIFVAGMTFLNSGLQAQPTGSGSLPPPAETSPNPFEDSTIDTIPVEEPNEDFEIVCKTVRVGVKIVVVCEKAKDLWHDVEDIWRDFWNLNGGDSDFGRITARDCGSSRLLNFHSDRSGILFFSKMNSGLNLVRFISVRFEFDLNSEESAQALKEIFDSHLLDLAEEARIIGGQCLLQ